MGVLAPALCMCLLAAIAWLECEQGAQVVTPVLSHFPTGEVRHSEIRAKQEEKSAMQEEIQLSLTFLEKKSS